MKPSVCAVVALLGLLAMFDLTAAGCFSMPPTPSIDTKTTFSIRKKADGIVVQKLCPGVDYIVKISFPEPRVFMAACTSGIFEALTGTCTNQTQKLVANTTWELPLTLPCDTVGDMFKFALASKLQTAASFLGKNISFPLNPFTSCPKSRCNLVTGNSSTAVTGLLSGIPLFDLFSKMGVAMGLGNNQLLTFDVSKLNKTLTSEAFLQVLMSISQFKLMSAKTLIDPTSILGLMSKLGSIVQVPTTGNTTSAQFYAECSKLVTLWSTFKVASASNQYAALISQLIPGAGAGVAYNYTALQSLTSTFFQSKNAADSMLNVMAAIGNVMSEGDFATPATSSVSVTSFMSVLGSYTTLLNYIN